VLFFLRVKTNVGYSVVAEFIIQSKTAEEIGEAISIFRGWNLQWKPKFFIVDYSEAEIKAIEANFSATKSLHL